MSYIYPWANGWFCKYTDDCITWYFNLHPQVSVPGPETKHEPCSVLQAPTGHPHASLQHQQQPYQHTSASSTSHMSPAQEEPVYVYCRHCNKAFQGRYAKYNLKRHLMIHRGEKPFSCPFCPHRANQKGNLKYHILSVHPEQSQPSGQPMEQGQPSGQPMEQGQPSGQPMTVVDHEDAVLTNVLMTADDHLNISAKNENMASGYSLSPP